MIGLDVFHREAALTGERNFALAQCGGEALGAGVNLYGPGDYCSFPPPRRFRLLVACHDIVLNGGLLRFDRVGAVLRAWGHEVAYVVLSDSPSAQRPSELPVLSFDMVSTQDWDAVMVPGAGFPDATIERFGKFRAPNFGVRLQHILNDQTRRREFKRVNALFAPHVVVFNNDHWPIGSFTDFQADRFHILMGAVDPLAFKPLPVHRHPVSAGRWIIGGQAGKNPEPLINALNHLPPNVMLRLFGPDHLNLAHSHRDMIDANRLELVGPLHGHDLSDFYHGIDCVVMTETSAGWANIAAEALASGVPVLCTPHGTGAFAYHNETALIMATPTPLAIVEGVKRLLEDPQLCRNLAVQGRRKICAYNWQNYGQQLLSLVPHDGRRHYAYAPEIGLHGKWSIEERLSGLEPLLEQAPGMTVADLGSAEGLIGLAFLKCGASLVHGFELDAGCVKFANKLCQYWGNTQFREADLSDWKNFESANADLLRNNYDIVLYLGIHHHLPEDVRLDVLNQAVARARQYFAIRTPLPLYEDESIQALIEAAGFKCIKTDDAESGGYLGSARIYERINAGARA